MLTHIIEDKARKQPNHVVFQFRDDPITLGDLNDRINKAANGLLALGVKPGDKVAIMLPNCPEFLYAWFGCNKIGAVEVPINVALKGAGLAYQIDQSDCVVLVADTEYLDRLEEVAEDSSPSSTSCAWIARRQRPLPRWQRPTVITFGELIGHRRHAERRGALRDIATILYTSGTTGVSKGVQMSHHYWYDIWAESVKYARYTEEDVLYTGLPFFHGNAQGITIGPAILADAKAVIVERFSASQLWDDCRRWECTEANYIGGIIPILLKQEPRDDDADNPVRLMVGAAAPADEWHAFQQRFNTKLLEVYGMTECYCCLASPYDEPRAGSCGKAITGWDVRIVDDDDNECPPGTPGEFIARSNKMFVGTTGYYKKPEATLELFQNGWIHTGDMGRMDADGYFYFVDRKKQAICRRGREHLVLRGRGGRRLAPCRAGVLRGRRAVRGGRGRGQGGGRPQGRPDGDAGGNHPLVRAAHGVLRDAALHRDPYQPAEDAQRAGGEIQAQGRRHHAPIAGTAKRPACN